MRKRGKSGPLDEAARVLRMRGDEELARTMCLPTTSRRGRLVARTRDAWRVGDVARVEISLGPLADEVILRGTVVDLRTGEDATQPEIEVEVDPLHEERLRYVAAVLDRERPATARRFRRVPATLGARWSTVAEEAASANAEHLLDLSRGGAFVVSTHAPAIGAELDLELDLGAMRRPLHVKGVVAWTGTNQGQGGFGVRFLVRDSELADRLAALVDELDDAPSIR